MSITIITKRNTRKFPKKRSIIMLFFAFEISLTKSVNRNSLTINWILQPIWENQYMFFFNYIYDCLS